MDHRADSTATVKIALTLCRKLYETCNFCKEGVVAANANVLSSYNLRAALADDDFTDRDCGTVGAFYAEVLRIRIVQVFSCSGGFCCCHKV